MSKFCPNCGSALEEGVAFCGNCGNKIAQPEASPAPQFIPAAEASPAPQFIPAAEASPAPQFVPAGQAFVPATPAKKPINKKPLIIGGAIVAAVVAIAIILISVLGGGGAASSPKGALDNYIATYNGDTSNLEALAPAEFWEYFAEDEGVSKKELIDELKEEIDEGVEELKEEYGKNFKITGKIEAEDKMDKDVLEKIATALSEYGIEEKDVKEGKDLTVKLTLKSSEGEEDDTGSIAAIKIGSSWYLINYREYNDECYVYFIVEQFT